MLGVTDSEKRKVDSSIAGLAAIRYDLVAKRSVATSTCGSERSPSAARAARPGSSGSARPGRPDPGPLPDGTGRAGQYRSGLFAAADTVPAGGSAPEW